MKLLFMISKKYIYNIRPWTNTRKVISINEENMRVDDKKRRKFNGWVDVNVR